jgi:serine/threonine-protein kinase
MTTNPVLVSAIAEQYRIEREFGGGGTSRVFVATTTGLERQVVIKVLSPELTEGSRRAASRARSASSPQPAPTQRAQG